MVRLWGKSNTGKEKSVDYDGAPPGMLSFFWSIPNILFRVKGSVLVNVWVETLLAFGMYADAGSNPLLVIRPDTCCVSLSALDCLPHRLRSTLAVVLNENAEVKEDMAITGHQIFGFSVSFLVIFRSQIAWGMYTEGRGHLGRVITATRDLGLEVIATLCASQISVQKQVEAAQARQEQRLMNEGATSITSQNRRLSITTAEMEALTEASVKTGRTVTFHEDNLVLAFEIVRMLKLFYFCMVEHLRSTEGTAAWRRVNEKTKKFASPNELAELLEEYGEVQEDGKRKRHKSNFHFLRYAAIDDVDIEVTQDPTRSKPLLVLAWIRMTLERGVNVSHHLHLQPSEPPGRDWTGLDGTGRDWTGLDGAGRG